MASFRSQWSSQTVPHSSPTHTSTRPLNSDPAASLMSPSSHTTVGLQGEGEEKRGGLPRKEKEEEEEEEVVVVAGAIIHDCTIIHRLLQ